MQQTQNFKLNKPDITDYAKIEALNENADIIDKKLTEVNSLQTDFTTHLDDLVKHGVYGVATGTNTLAMMVTLPASITAYPTGMLVAFKNTTVNTGAVTLNVNGLGEKTIRKANGSTLVAGSLKAGGVYQCRYDGVNFMLLGEGGEYGTATAADVRSTKTFGTEDGVIQGRLDLSKLTAGNIRDGVTIDGVTGTVKTKGYTDQLLEQNEKSWTYTPSFGTKLIGTFLTKEGNVVTVSTKPTGGIVDCVNGKTGVRIFAVEITTFIAAISNANMGEDGYIYVMVTTKNGTNIAKIHAITGVITNINIPALLTTGEFGIFADKAGSIYIGYRDTYNMLRKYSVTGSTTKLEWSFDSGIHSANRTGGGMYLSDINALVFSPSSRQVLVNATTGIGTTVSDFDLSSFCKAAGIGEAYITINNHNAINVAKLKYTAGATSKSEVLLRSSIKTGSPFGLNKAGELNLDNNGEFLYIANEGYGMKYKASTLEMVAIFPGVGLSLVNKMGEFYSRDAGNNASDITKWKFFSTIR